MKHLKAEKLLRLQGMDRLAVDVQLVGRSWEHLSRGPGHELLEM